VLIDLGRVYQRLADESMVPPVVPAPRAPEPAAADGEPKPEDDTADAAVKDDDAVKDDTADEDTSDAGSTDGPGWIAGSDGIARAEAAGA
jgi:hypothetical protein